jgi:hypothetical protein
LLSMYLPDLSIEQAIQAFTDQLAQNLPAVFRDVHVRDLMLYWCDAAAGVQLPDGTWAYAGFGFNATLDIYGLRAHGALKIDSSGITGDACIDPLHVQGIIDLTGRGAGTPATYVGQVTVKAGGPEIKVSTLASPYLVLDWRVVLFGTMAQTVDAEVTQSGFTFEVANAGPGYSSALSCTLQLPDRLAISFSVMLNLDVDLGVVNGTRLGQVHLANTGLSASLFASATPSVAIVVNGTFSLDGTAYTMPQLSLSVPFRSLSEIPQRIFQQLKDDATTLFGELRTSADAYLELAHKGIVRTAGDVGTVLHGAFQQTADQAAVAMKTAGYQLSEIGAALQKDYAATAQQAAESLKQAGYTVDEIAGELKAAYGLAAGQAATVLKQAGFSFDDIGTGLHIAFQLAAQELAAILKTIGDGIEQLGNFLKELFGLGPNELGPILQALGYAADEVKQFFENLGEEFEEAVKHLDPTTW